MVPSEIDMPKSFDWKSTNKAEKSLVRVCKGIYTCVKLEYLLGMCKWNNYYWRRYYVKY
jgi:hypothetical protein